MYLTKRGRPGLETTLAFLCTRVTKSTEFDWCKLKRILEWLKYTENKELGVMVWVS